MKKNRNKSTIPGTLLFLFVFLQSAIAFGHCDTLDGPVVMAAQKSLETGNVDDALIWVQAKDEKEVKEAFKHVTAVRKNGPGTKEFFDHSFFELIVRLHRAGEGAAYTGLKPEGFAASPAVIAADQAIANGSDEGLLNLLTKEIQDGFHRRFQAVISRKDFDPHNIEAGREYVKAYVDFLHYAERIHKAAIQPAHGHYDDEQIEHQEPEAQ